MHASTFFNWSQQQQEDDDIVGEKEKEVVWFFNRTQEEDDIVGEKEKELVCTSVPCLSDVPTFGWFEVGIGFEDGELV